MKRRNNLFWPIFVLIVLLLILGAALYFSNKYVLKETFSVQTVMVLDPDENQVEPSVVVMTDLPESEEVKVVWDTKSEETDKTESHKIEIVFEKTEPEKEEPSEIVIVEETPEKDVQQRRIKNGCRYGIRFLIHSRFPSRIAGLCGQRKTFRHEQCFSSIFLRMPCFRIRHPGSHAAWFHSSFRNPS